jgi:hypothetical protein
MSNPLVNLLPTWAWVLLVAGVWTFCLLGFLALCGWVKGKDREMAEALDQMHDQPPTWHRPSEEFAFKSMKSLNGPRVVRADFNRRMQP